MKHLTARQDTFYTLLGGVLLVSSFFTVPLTLLTLGISFTTLGTCLVACVLSGIIGNLLLDKTRV